MERLSLHADINRLQRVEAHLRGRWLLLCLLRLRCATAHTHLRELLCNTLHTLLQHTRRTLDGVGRLRRLVSSLWRTILRLAIAWLGTRSRRARVAVLRLLWHAV